MGKFGNTSKLESLKEKNVDFEIIYILLIYCISGFMTVGSLLLFLFFNNLNYITEEKLVNLFLFYIVAAFFTCLYGYFITSRSKKC